MEFGIEPTLLNKHSTGILLEFTAILNYSAILGGPK